MKDLVEKVATYKRCVKGLLDTLNEIERILTAELPPRFNFSAANIVFVDEYKRSNVGTWGEALCFKSHNGTLKVIPEAVNRAGESGYVHNDFNVVYHYATRDELMEMARNLPKFLDALLSNLKKKAETSEGLTEMLKAMLEAAA